MVPLALALSTPVAAFDGGEPVPEITFSQPVDLDRLARARSRQQLATRLGWTAAAGLATSFGGAALLVGTCDFDRGQFGGCPRGAQVAGWTMLFAGSTAFTVGQLGFVTAAPLAESYGVDAGLSMRPRFGWAPLVLNLAGLGLATWGRNLGVRRPVLSTTGTAMYGLGLVLGMVQVTRVRRAHRRHVSVTPTGNGAQAVVRF
ncbi:MAG: hypothetical protein AAGA48_00305 [Myxococcota bacterium]